MVTKEILIKARSLIEKGWTKGCFARDAKGDHVDPTESSACKWCTTGAIWRVVGYDGRVKYQEACSVLDDLVCSDFNNVTQFNDYPETTQAGVLNLFDKAIEGCDNDD